MKGAASRSAPFFCQNNAVQFAFWRYNQSVHSSKSEGN